MNFTMEMDRGDDIPLNFPSIRGNVNSVLLLEPDGLKSTKFYYVIEVQANGNNNDYHKHRMLACLLTARPIQ